MKETDKIFVAGHNGMVGSAIVRALQRQKFNNIIFRSRQELDLLDKTSVESFFDIEKPDIVILAAAKVGGIRANMEYPVEFLYDNLSIQNNVIHCCHINQVKKFVFLGSSCIYPANAPQPIKEDYLMTGPLEPTNEGYALAKIAGLKLAQYYSQEYGLDCLCPMPCNLYGFNDSFDPLNSHVLSAIVRKFVDAVDEGKDNVVMWGTGKARREFMHVDDLADAILFLIDHWKGSSIINVGTGTDVTIADLANLIAKKINYTGTISWDTSMPDGMLKKCLDITKLHSLGFTAKIPLERGIENVIQEYKQIKN